MPALTNILLGMKENAGLVGVIANAVIIVLLILIIFHLHSIDEHLNWIRRIR